MPRESPDEFARKRRTIEEVIARDSEIEAETRSVVIQEAGSQIPPGAPDPEWGSLLITALQVVDGSATVADLDAEVTRYLARIPE